MGASLVHAERAVADKKEDKTVTKTIHTIHTLHWGVELEMNLREVSYSRITEKAPTRAFSMLEGAW